MTLDLGGGSTQIVFVPGRRVEGLEGRRHYMHDVSVMGSTVAAYSHSYLGRYSIDIVFVPEPVFRNMWSFDTCLNL